jgi:hypothetical protein
MAALVLFPIKSDHLGLRGSALYLALSREYAKQQGVYLAFSSLRVIAGCRLYASVANGPDGPGPG